MRAQIAGRTVGYELAGAGPPLVLLHAFPFDRRMWQDTGAALAGRRTVIAPDLRGFGESALAPFSIADLADDVAALLDALGHPRATVAGLSMGGYVALAFAQRHPARLAGLVLADTKAGPDTPEARQARGEAIALVRREGVAAYLEKQLPRLLAPGAAESVRARLRAIGGTQAPEAVIAGLEALRDRPDRRSELGAITVPTLIVVGAEDGLTPPTEARSMAAAISGARLVEVPGAGHISNVEAPDAFGSALATAP
jgi:pimeloyl-ACP methyl ester carboxylesterase